MNVAELTSELKKILTISLEVAEENLNSDSFLIIYDQLSPLSERLLEGYKNLLPQTRLLEYFAHTAEEVIAEVNKCKKGDLVILIESSSFRMSQFRWRLELFNRGLKVIEHAHLGNNSPDQTENYLDSLRFDGDFYQKVGNSLTEKLNKAAKVKVISQSGAELTYEGPFEDTKKNIGDFSTMPNKGCGYPIGEVFTEPSNITKLNGEVDIFAFADNEHLVVFPDKPFKLLLNGGQVTLTEDLQKLSDQPGRWNEWQRSLMEVWALLTNENPDGSVWARELGLGMNRGISREKRLTDISAYERVCGVHMSLGMKHDIYRNKAKVRPHERYHIDIFPDVSEVWIDDEQVFADGKYLVV